MVNNNEFCLIRSSPVESQVEAVSRVKLCKRLGEIEEVEKI